MSVIDSLEDYRREAATFYATLERADYRHSAGHTTELPIAEIYDRYADLFDPSVATELIREIPNATGDRARSLRALAFFAADGAIDGHVRAERQALGEAEAALTAEVGGASVPFRDLPNMVANTADADERRRLEGRWLSLLDGELGPRYEEIWRGRHQAAERLGADSYKGIYAQILPEDLDALGAQAARFLTETQPGFEPALDAFLRRGAGVGLSRAGTQDWRRAIRAHHLDAHFPAARLVPALLETLDGLGLRLREQSNIVLDIEPRPGKVNRAFCAPPDPPREVYLVIAPAGGLDDYSSLFHEAGHAEHYGCVGASLPFEFRCLGDNAVTETFAFLFEGLLHDPVWLEDVLGVRDTSGIVRHVGMVRTYLHRRYCAKLIYELELHAGNEPLSHRDRYAELLTEATRLPWPAERSLEDVDPAFYVSAYARAWVLECGLRQHLRERFGSRWYRTREAGLFLREIWEDGQRLNGQELAAEIGLGEIDLSLLVADDLALVDL